MWKMNVQRRSAVFVVVRSSVLAPPPHQARVKGPAKEIQNEKWRTVNRSSCDWFRFGATTTTTKQTVNSISSTSGQSHHVAAAALHFGMQQRGEHKNTNKKKNDKNV